MATVNEEIPPLVLMVRQALLNSSEKLHQCVSKLSSFEIIQDLEEILRSWDINLDVSTEPLSFRPFLLIRRQPFSILVYTRAKAYEVWPNLREISGSA